MMYEIVDGKKLRCGYTTGTCAQAATKAAATMLLTKKEIPYIEVTTPSGVDLKIEVFDIEITESYVSCAVKKDSGDDPDITDGILIYARVEKSEKTEVDGGFGVGRIVKKGLFGELGEAAINPVPKKFILSELEKLGGGLKSTIIVPQGEKIGKKTFNPAIGIEGGISIIGTSGIVKPMSEEAFIKSIYIEIDLILQENPSCLAMIPGNHAEKMLKKMGYEKAIKVSNFWGKSLSYAYEQGVREFIIIGHIGKLSKLSIGIFNTHNRTSDSRMEAFVYYMAKKRLGYDLIDRVDASFTAEEAMGILLDEGYDFIISDMEEGIEKRIKKYLKDEEISVKVKIYSMREVDD